MNHDYNSALLTEHQRTITEYNHLLNTNAPNILTTTQGDLSARKEAQKIDHLSVPKGVTGCPIPNDLIGPGCKVGELGALYDDIKQGTKKSSNHATHDEAYDSSENTGTNN